MNHTDFICEFVDFWYQANKSIPRRWRVAVAMEAVANIRLAAADDDPLLAGCAEAVLKNQSWMAAAASGRRAE